MKNIKLQFLMSPSSRVDSLSLISGIKLLTSISRLLLVVNYFTAISAGICNVYPVIVSHFPGMRSELIICS